MTLLGALLARLAGRATLWLPVAVALGIVFQDLAARLQPIVIPCVTLLLMHAMVRADLPALGVLLRAPVRALAVLAALVLGVPLAAAALLPFAGLPAGLTQALLLMTCCPVLTAAPTLSTFLRLDRELALFVSLASNALMPLTLPLLALWLVGLKLEIGVLEMMGRLAAIVGAAALGALVVRRALGSRLPSAAPTLDGLAVVVLLVFAVPIMNGVGAALRDEPARLALFVGAAFGATFFCMALGALAFAPAGRRLAASAGYLAGARNNAVLLAALPVGAPPDVLLFIAAVQAPIYLMPTLLKPVLARLLPERA